MRRIAGHSARIGLAHDLDAFGARDREIMQAAGWKSLASLMRYLQSRQVAEGEVHLDFTEAQLDL